MSASLLPGGSQHCGCWSTLYSVGIMVAITAQPRMKKTIPLSSRTLEANLRRSIDTIANITMMGMKTITAASTIPPVEKKYSFVWEMTTSSIKVWGAPATSKG